MLRQFDSNPERLGAKCKCYRCAVPPRLIQSKLQNKKNDHLLKKWPPWSKNSNPEELFFKKKFLTRIRKKYQISVRCHLDQVQENKQVVLGRGGRGGCLAQRQRYCFSPNRPGFDSWHSRKFTSLLLRFINGAV